MALFASPIVEVAGPSDISRLISVGTWQYNYGPYPVHGPTRLAFKWKENVD